MQPRNLLRLEGLALLVVATGAYFASGFGWVLFLVLILAPDLSMLGYLANPRVGSAAYNLAHLLALPAALLAGSWYVSWAPGIGLALIWSAHVGIDRAAGYGMKYADAEFGETHIQRV